MQTQNTLVKIQPAMKADLLAGVEDFQTTVQNFYSDYDIRYCYTVPLSNILSVKYWVG